MDYDIQLEKGSSWHVNSLELSLNRSFKSKESVFNYLEDIRLALINNEPLNELINKSSFITVTQIIVGLFSKEFSDYAIWFVSNRNLDEKELNLEYVFEQIFNRELSKSKRVAGFTDILLNAINNQLAIVRIKNRKWSSEPKVKIELIKNYNNVVQWKINDSELSFRGSQFVNIDIVKIMINDVYDALINDVSLVSLTNYYSLGSIIKICTDVFCSEFREFVSRIVTLLIDNQVILSNTNITKAIFDRHGNGAIYSGEYKEILNEAVKNQYYLQYCGMKNQVDMNIDLWKINFNVKNVISTVNLDFAFIKSSALKKEVKHYLKSKLKDKIILESRYKSLRKTIPYLQDKCGIKYCADINMTSVANLYRFLENEEKISVSYQLQINASMKEFIDWIIEHSKQIKTFQPNTNYFKKIKITNLSNMTENTEYIPEMVIQKMLEHLEDLKPMYQRLFLIMLNTGLHFKDTAYLTDDCYDYDEANDIHLLSFIQWKNLKRRRKAGLSDHIEIPIHKEVAIEVKNQIEETKALRRKSGLKEIFVHENRNRIKIFDGKAFVNAVNKMIEKNNITTEDGVLWRFTTRQCRKTLAVDMIMNGASPQEVAYYLVHGSEHTTSKYYAEVRKYKLAEMNSDFWEKEFKLAVSEEQLKEFSVEDRKKLFVDFKLQIREVELGMCMKPVWEGSCSKRTGSISCATCNKICVGIDHYSKWKKLFTSQEKILKDMRYMYEKLGVADYETYRDYQKEKYLLDSYQNVLEKLDEKFGVGNVQ